MAWFPEGLKEWRLADGLVCLLARVLVDASLAHKRIFQDLAGPDRQSCAHGRHRYRGRHGCRTNMCCRARSCPQTERMAKTQDRAGLTKDRGGDMRTGLDWTGLDEPLASTTGSAYSCLTLLHRTSQRVPRSAGACSTPLHRHLSGVVSRAFLRCQLSSRRVRHSANAARVRREFTRAIASPSTQTH